MGFVSDTATIYNEVHVIESEIGDHAILADNCDILRSSISPYARVGRRGLIIETSIGEGSYTGSNAVVKNTEIGKYCCLSWDISIGGDAHNYRAASLYDDLARRKTLGVEFSDGEAFEGSKRTRIGSDVWMGAGSQVLSGIHVGDGAVIGAGAIVLKDVPDYAVVVGTPARIVKYRFDEGTRARLLKLRWWDWDREAIRAAAHLLHGNLTPEKLSGLEAFSLTNRSSDDAF